MPTEELGASGKSCSSCVFPGLCDVIHGQYIIRVLNVFRQSGVYNFIMITIFIITIIITVFITAIIINYYCYCYSCS